MAAPAANALITPFPFGVSSYGVPIVGNGNIQTTGEVFFVDNTAASKGDDTNHGRSPQTPFQTLDYAIGQCAANRGDTICVLAGHSETIITAAGINCDVAGVRIIGFQEGRSRPTFLFSTSVNASLAINAANVTVENLVLNFTGIDAIAGGIDVNAANFTLRDCEIITAAVAGQATKTIVTDVNCSRLRIVGNIFNGSVNAGTESVIEIADASEDIEIAYNRLRGSYSNGGIYANSGSTPATSLFIHHNQIETLGTAQFAINIQSACTGILAYNILLGSDITVVLELPTSMAPIENYGYDNDTANTIGQLVPILGSQLPVNSTIIDQVIGNQFSSRRANYLAVVTSFASATWNTVASHEVFIVTGAVRMRIIPECTSDLTSGGAATIAFGLEGTTNAFIAATLGTDIDTGEMWLTGTPAKQFAFSSVIDRVISGGLDVGFEIAVAALTGGSITWHCVWEPINATGEVTAGLGGVL